MSERIIIATNHPLDTGGAFPRALEERKIAFDILDLSQGFPSPTNNGGIIALGSPHVNSPAQVAWYGDLINAGIPGIGICVAEQGMGAWLGGTVRTAANSEIGFTDTSGQPFGHVLTDAGRRDPVLQAASTGENLGVVFEFHKAKVDPDPNTTLVLAQGRDGTVQALRARRQGSDEGGPLLGVQFHPELETREGFITIYREAFGLEKHIQDTLRDQHEEYQDANVGHKIVDAVIEDMTGASR